MKLNLIGDRLIENAFIMTYMPSNKQVLDVGSNLSPLSKEAAELQNDVTAIDLSLQAYPQLPNHRFIQADFNEAVFDRLFDYIYACSSLEHFGLEGRYGAAPDKQADIKAVQKMRKLLMPCGWIAITIPVGQSDIIEPLHRIYGVRDLITLFDGLEIVEQFFYGKNVNNVWIRIEQEEAFKTQGSETYYSLGCFLLRQAGE